MECCMDCNRVLREQIDISNELTISFGMKKYALGCFIC